MADLSKIKLNGIEYDLKDNIARTLIVPLDVDETTDPVQFQSNEVTFQEAVNAYLSGRRVILRLKDGGGDDAYVCNYSETTLEAATFNDDYGGNIRIYWDEAEGIFIENIEVFNGNYNDLSNKPTLATVATSGSYDDLNNKPTLATVATSGNYNDLNNKPDTSSFMIKGVDYVTAGKKSESSLGANATAEGKNTIANAIAAHAEGYYTTATGRYGSHAEGFYTTASQTGAHAEGSNTTASAASAHAEGEQTIASGVNSHAEGNNTIAQRKDQHVFGAYNKADTTEVTTGRGSYIEIVGNGVSDNNRSNARTLSWVGNEVLAGKLTIGSAPTEDMDVTTKQYVDNKITTDIATAIGSINQFEVAIVTDLPATDIDTHTIYFKSNSSSGDNIYDEYMYINNNWELIGSTAIDLSNYLQTSDIADWAKATTKPSYTATEVGALPDTTIIPTVPSNISAFTNDVGYISSYTETDPVFTASAAAGISSTDITNWNAKSDFSGSYNDLEDKPTIPTVPTNVSAFNNDAGYLTSYTETDPTVPAWAKAATKPTYTAAEVGALPDTTVIPAAQVNADWDATGGVAQILHKPTIPNVPTWALESTKPTYTAEEVGAISSSTVIPKKVWNVTYGSYDGDYWWTTGLQRSDLVKITNAPGSDGAVRYINIPSKNPYNTIIENSNWNTASEDIKILLPNRTGTIALTSDIPNVPAWALTTNKPTYTAAEVGALPSTYTAPVTSVNGQTGEVNLTIPAAQVQSDWNATSGMGVILNKPTIPAATTVTNTLASGTLIATINGTNIYAPAYTDADGVSY